MRMNVWMLSLMTCLALTATANAQGRGRGGGMGGGGFGSIFRVAGNEAAQKELGLTADEAAKVKAVTDAYDTAGREARAASGIQFGFNMSAEDREKMAAISKTNSDKFLPQLKAALTADQFTRLQQLHWQNQGTSALSDAEIIKALTITKDQQDKIKTLNDEYGTKTGELFAGGAGGNRQEAFQKSQELNKERDVKITEVLTKDQQDKFAALKGKEFDVTQLRGFGRGGGGGGGNAGGGGGGNGGGRAKRPQPKAE